MRLPDGASWPYDVRQCQYHEIRESIWQNSSLFGVANPTRLGTIRVTRIRVFRVTPLEPKLLEKTHRGGLHKFPCGLLIKFVCYNILSTAHDVGSVCYVLDHR
jgi:hypothetical protein